VFSKKEKTWTGIFPILLKGTKTMKTMLHGTLSLLIVMALTLLGTSTSAQAPRTALVIGNGNYKTSPLRNPVHDASDMARVLKRLGFKVIHKQNASQKEMERAIQEFGKQLRGGGVGLFYYAGHGIQLNGRNYLIPVDAEIETESDVRFEGVDSGRVLGKMEDAGNALNVVILDACRDNPFARSFRSNAQGLARIDAPRGSLIVYATAPGSVAADGEGRNGIFTKYLLKHMNTPNLAIEDLLKKVRMDVVSETNGKQTPWESSSLMGEFCFSSRRGISVVARPKEPGQQEMKPQLREEMERLEKERQELERLRAEIERKKLAAERTRLEAERQKLEVASVQPRKEIPPLTRFQSELAGLIEKAERNFPNAEQKLTWKSDEGSRTYTTNLSLSDAKKTTLWKDRNNAPYLACDFFHMAPGVAVFPVYERLVKEIEGILDADWKTSSSKEKRQTEFIAVNRRTGVKIKLYMTHYQKGLFSQGPDENDLNLFIHSPSIGRSN